jgi:hypothetical protein
MKRILPLLFLLFFALTLQAQRDTSSYAASKRYISRESSEIKLNIYPVPVTNNFFTIKSDRDISFVKITNIIGQDIFRIKYNNPQQLIKISLDAPQRGMYLVTIIFSDGIRIVKKIMIEESK